MTTNKFEYLKVLQGYYYGQWEDLSASLSNRDIKDDLKAYRNNEGGIYRIITRRELV